MQEDQLDIMPSSKKQRGKKKKSKRSQLIDKSASLDCTVNLERVLTIRTGYLEELHGCNPTEGSEFEDSINSIATKNWACAILVQTALEQARGGNASYDMAEQTMDTLIEDKAALDLMKNAALGSAHVPKLVDLNDDMFDSMLSKYHELEDESMYKLAKHWHFSRYPRKNSDGVMNYHPLRVYLEQTDAECQTKLLSLRYLRSRTHLYDLCHFDADAAKRIYSFLKESNEKPPIQNEITKTVDVLKEHGLLTTVISTILRGFDDDCPELDESRLASNREMIENWFNVIRDLQDPSTNVSSIMVILNKLMSRETSREYYKSTDYYCVALSGAMFTCHLCMRESAALALLTNNEDIVGFICRAMFLGTHGGLDLEAFDQQRLNMIRVFSESLLCKLLLHWENCSAPAKEYLQLAKTKVGNEESGDIHFVHALTGVIRISRIRSYPNPNRTYSVLAILAKNDCVDAEFIANIVHLGMGLISDDIRPESRRFTEAKCVLSVLKNILCPIQAGHGSRTRRFGIAVKSGLFLMCLNFTDCLQLGPQSYQLLDDMDDILKGLNHCSHKAKIKSAIDNLNNAESDEIENIPYQVNGDERDEKRAAILRQIHSVYISCKSNITRNCCRCGTLMRKGSIYRCEKCATPYCSSACQTLDWRQGNHKQRCARS